MGKILTLIILQNVHGPRPGDEKVGDPAFELVTESIIPPLLFRALQRADLRCLPLKLTHRLFEGDQHIRFVLLS